MKTYAPLLCIALAGCAGANPPPTTTTTSSAVAAVADRPGGGTGERQPALPRGACGSAEPQRGAVSGGSAERERSAEPQGNGGDPLAMDGAVGALPRIVFTPKRELRHNGASDLKEAFAIATRQAGTEAAATKLTKRLGKPNWVENGQKRVWVVGDAQQCQRLILNGDGSVDLDGAPRSAWTMLSTFARQNTCSGEIEKERRD